MKLNTTVVYDMRICINKLTNRQTTPDVNLRVLANRACVKLMKLYTTVVYDMRICINKLTNRQTTPDVNLRVLANTACVKFVRRPS